MKGRFLILLLLFILTVGFVSFKVTHALFSDSANSNNNTFAAAEVFPTPTPDLTGIATHVVISEVQISTSGPSGTNHDFVEFYNPTLSSFDLNGHRLVKRTGSSPNDTTIKSWTSSAIIPAHGFYLWASSDDGYSASISADISTAENIAPSNSIALRFGSEDTGTIIDALSWNSAAQSLKEGTEFSPNPGDNQSLERKALSTSTASAMMSGGSDEFKGNGYDAGNNSTDFILRTTSDPQNSSSGTEIP